MSGEKDFLDEFAEQDTAAEIATNTTAPVEPAFSGPARGPDGKFVRKEAQAKAEQAETGAKEAAQEQVVTEPPSGDEESQYVPLSVVVALRKELQELKRSQGQATQTQPKGPEFIRPQVAFDEDPKSYLEQTMHAQKMQMSTFLATQQSDEQTVRAAWAAFDEACRTDPAVSAYSHALLDHPHPMGELVKWYRERQELEAIRAAGGIDNLVQQRLAAMGIQPVAGQAQKTAVPPSLAGTGKARASDATGEAADGFDVLFKR